jgi:hypothetical protein
MAYKTRFAVDDEGYYILDFIDENPYLNKCPNDVLFGIMDFLDLVDIKNLSAINKKFRKLITTSQNIKNRIINFLFKNVENNLQPKKWGIGFKLDKIKPKNLKSDQIIEAFISKYSRPVELVLRHCYDNRNDVEMIVKDEIESVISYEGPSYLRPRSNSGKISFRTNYFSYYLLILENKNYKSGEVWIIPEKDVKYLISLFIEQNIRIYDVNNKTIKY